MSRWRACSREPGGKHDDAEIIPLGPQAPGPGRRRRRPPPRYLAASRGRGTGNGSRPAAAARTRPGTRRRPRCPVDDPADGEADPDAVDGRRRHRAPSRRRPGRRAARSPRAADHRPQTRTRSAGMPFGDWLARASSRAAERLRRLEPPGSPSSWPSCAAGSPATTSSTSTASTRRSPSGSSWRRCARWRTKWFRVEVRGVENIPTDGGALVVSNHSGTIPSTGS